MPIGLDEGGRRTKPLAADVQALFIDGRSSVARNDNGFFLFIGSSLSEASTSQLKTSGIPYRQKMLELELRFGIGG
jgi:hypothetical protein